MVIHCPFTSGIDTDTSWISQIQGLRISAEVGEMISGDAGKLCLYKPIFCTSSNFSCVKLYNVTVYFDISSFWIYKEVINPLDLDASLPSCSPKYGHSANMSGYSARCAASRPGANDYSCEVTRLHAFPFPMLSCLIQDQYFTFFCHFPIFVIWIALSRW